MVIQLISHETRVELGCMSVFDKFLLFYLLVCKHSVDEFLNELSASSSKNVLKLGHVLQPEEHQKTIVYEKS